MHVEFDEEPLEIRSTGYKQGGTRLTGWLIRKQFVKTEKQAAWLLVGLIVVCVIASIFIVAISNKGSQLTEKQIQDITKRQQAH